MAESVGSYAEFLAQTGMEDGPDAINAHSVALQGLRQRIADERGVSLEELHSNPNGSQVSESEAA
jgi:hypothetical protein